SFEGAESNTVKLFEEGESLLVGTRKEFVIQRKCQWTRSRSVVRLMKNDEVLHNFKRDYCLCPSRMHEYGFLMTLSSTEIGLAAEFTLYLLKPKKPVEEMSFMRLPISQSRGRQRTGNVHIIGQK